MTKEQGEFIASFHRRPVNSAPYQRPQSELPLTTTTEEVKALEEEVVGVNLSNRVISPSTAQTGAIASSNIPKLTAEEKMALNAQGRQELALRYVREQGLISHKVYQELTGASESTATRDLKQLIANGALRQIGRGPGRKYVI